MVLGSLRLPQTSFPGFRWLPANVMKKESRQNTCNLKAVRVGVGGRECQTGHRRLEGQGKGPVLCLLSALSWAVPSADQGWTRFCSFCVFSCTTAFPRGAQCLPSAPGFLQDPGSQALAGFAGCETLSRHLAGCMLSLFGCSSPGPGVVGGRGAEESGQAAFFTQRKVGLLDFPSAFFLRSPHPRNQSSCLSGRAGHTCLCVLGW